MRTLRQWLVGPLVLVLSISSAAYAQERHLVDPAALAASVSQHAAQQEADRAVIREALGHPEVQAVAATLGVDTNRLSSAISTLTGDDLARAAGAARDANRSLVGGASAVIISTTTIIIVLLLVLLIVVVAD